MSTISDSQRIVDPERRTISVLTLDGTAYRVTGEFDEGQSVTSILFPQFSVTVRSAFEAGEAGSQ